MFRIHALICGGTGCTSSGSMSVKDALEREIAAKGLEEEVNEYGKLELVVDCELAGIKDAVFDGKEEVNEYCVV